MKVNESFAVEATEEVRRDPRFEWYVNWLRSLENMDAHFAAWKEEVMGSKFTHYGLDNGFYKGVFKKKFINKILTIDEVYSRFGKEIYEANGIEWYFDGKMYYHRTGEPTNLVAKQEEIDSIRQPFQGSRDYDEELLRGRYEFTYKASNGEYLESVNYILDKEYLNHKYGDPNESILKQIAEHKAKIEELKKKLR